MQSTFWNDRYSEPEFAYGTEPNAFVREQAHRIPAGGRVLCLGEGEGRNAVWLAQQGHAVVAVDLSQVGLQRTRELAAARGVNVETLQADLASFEPEPGAFDASVSVFVHLPAPARAFMHGQAMRALRNGGLFIAEFFSTKQLAFQSGGPTNLDMLYTPDMIRDDLDRCGFADVQSLEELEVELSEGKYHRGRAAVVRLIAARL